jgi:hypothetical protein
MNGFEYEVAGHMIWEGLLTEGLAVARAVHDRYHPSRRNPWNEVECGDHYARSMASYGVFLAACGFAYHGPKGHLGFAPRLAPDNFQCAFTAAEGWGTYWQKCGPQSAEYGLSLKWGKLRLRTLALALPERFHPATARAEVDGQTAESKHSLAGNRLTVTFADAVELRANQELKLAVQ